MWNLLIGTISIIFWISIIGAIIVIASSFTGGNNTGTSDDDYKY
jgi:uncharacterized membrane protein